jgi:two-component system response regulator ResD
VTLGAPTNGSRFAVVLGGQERDVQAGRANEPPTGMETSAMTADRERVLIVERDPSLRSVVREKLAPGAVDVVEDAGRDDVARLAARIQPDVVVLELAGYTGTDRLIHLREVTDVPVIALLDRIVDCVDALELGADDYLEKPLAPRELIAKIRSALRRRQRPTVPGLLIFDDLQIDRRAHEVRLDGRRIRVPVREFELLCFLARAPGQAFRRDELLREVWQASPDFLGLDTVTEHVRRLRHRIEADPARPRRIQTVRGYGYRFCG